MPGKETYPAIPGTSIENAIEGAGGQTIVDLLSRVLSDPKLKSLRTVYIDSNGKTLRLNRDGSNPTIDVLPSTGGQPISQAEANNFLRRAIQANAGNGAWQPLKK